MQDHIVTQPNDIKKIFEKFLKDCKQSNKKLAKISKKIRKRKNELLSTN